MYYVKIISDAFGSKCTRSALSFFSILYARKSVYSYTLRNVSNDCHHSLRCASIPSSLLALSLSLCPIFHSIKPGREWFEKSVLCVQNELHIYSNFSTVSLFRPPKNTSTISNLMAFCWALCVLWPRRRRSSLAVWHYILLPIDFECIPTIYVGITSFSLFLSRFPSFHFVCLDW